MTKPTRRKPASTRLLETKTLENVVGGYTSDFPTPAQIMIQMLVQTALNAADVPAQSTGHGG